MTAPRRDHEAGYTLIALMATVTIMLLTMTAGVPFWRYVVKDDREQELLFRGIQIAKGIARYQAKYQNASPPSLEVLVEMKLLRQLYRDPTTESGEWRLVRQGEALGPPRPPGSDEETTTPGSGAAPRPRPGPPTGLPQTAGLAPGATTVGGIVGVASRSEEQSLRLVNGTDRYDQWLFTAAAGQPQEMIVGRQVQLPAGGSPPGGAPTPLPSGQQRGAPTPLQLPGPTTQR